MLIPAPIANQYVANVSSTAAFFRTLVLRVRRGTNYHRHFGDVLPAELVSAGFDLSCLGAARRGRTTLPVATSHLHVPARRFLASLFQSDRSLFRRKHGGRGMGPQALH